jgi:hypothetical protein
MARIISFSSPGKTSMMRSMVLPGLRCRHGQADRFQVAHFAHQNRVRVFAQGRAQGGGKTHRMRAHLALGDQAFLGFMHKLDRVFDRQDVAEFGLVEVVHHGGQRG